MDIDEKESYTMEEASKILNQAILEEAEILRKNLREKRKVENNNLILEYV